MSQPKNFRLFIKLSQPIWAECAQCFGHGEDICQECEGEGCGHCDQRGYAVCRICYGMGEVRSDELTWIAVQS
ncbi:hypothetical protein [Sulfobacillus thermosulfidooxidans]|uniref:hypothetical protein n=1 Tax=Sulfobacillus thermosulfidooxidans TaxID=28034 RepID=UPI0003049D27|nr:hypothetical protein [Sulfobacillus thermosulfidooxidans]